MYYLINFSQIIILQIQKYDLPPSAGLTPKALPQTNVRPVLLSPKAGQTPTGSPSVQPTAGTPRVISPMVKGKSVKINSVFLMYITSIYSYLEQRTIKKTHLFTLLVTIFLRHDLVFICVISSILLILNNIFIVLIKVFSMIITVRNAVPKIVTTNASVILPVVAQSSTTTADTEVPAAKATQASMSGIQALAAAAAATQKITVSPSQIKVG